jgi:hypothetical protein
MVYVITEVPAVAPVTTPVDALMEATEGEAEDHNPPVMVEVIVEVPFEQIAVVPESVPAEGAAVTVTLVFAIAFEQPPVPDTVYVKTEVPADNPVIKPVVELIVATEFVAEDQIPPDNDEDNVGVDPTQIAVVPYKIPADGGVVTVTVAVVETLAHPPVPVIV